MAHSHEDLLCAHSSCIRAYIARAGSNTDWALVVRSSVAMLFLNQKKRPRQEWVWFLLRLRENLLRDMWLDDERDFFAYFRITRQRYVLYLSLYNAKCLVKSLKTRLCLGGACLEYIQFWLPRSLLSLELPSPCKITCRDNIKKEWCKERRFHVARISKSLLHSTNWIRTGDGVSSAGFLVGPLLPKQATFRRTPITPTERLSLTFR